MDFLLWSDSLLYPRDTFRAEVEHSSFRGAAKNVMVAGLIYGAVTGLLYDLFPSLNGLFLPGLLREFLQGYSLLSNIFLSPLVFLLLLFLSSAVLFVCSRLCEGYGNFRTQSYLLSAIAAPLILAGLLPLIPYIGRIMMLLLFIYAVRALFQALRESHKYNNRAVIMSLSLSLVVVVIVSFLLTALLLQLGYSIGSWGHLEKNSQGFKKVVVMSATVSYQPHGQLEFKVINTLDQAIILTGLVSGDDCRDGDIDLDATTAKKESFAIIPAKETIFIKVRNCQKKFMLKEFITSRFFVPLHFTYQEKEIGRGVLHLERGVVEGMAG